MHHTTQCVTDNMPSWYTSDSRVRCWFGTVNNFTDQDYEKMKTFFVGCTWAICGKEVASTGTPHLQWACTMKNAKTFSAMRTTMSELLGRPIDYIMPTRSKEAAEKYCQKEGDFEEWGKRPVGERKRTDIIRMNDIIEDMKADPDKHVFDHLGDDNGLLIMSHLRALKEYASFNIRMKQVPNKPQFEVILCIGASGSGKSRWLAETYPDAFWVTYGASGQPTWFDGYKGEETIVLDDFKGSMQYTQFLRLCDRYKQDLPVKGSTVPGVHTRIVLTSICEPSAWYDYSHATRKLREVERRITRVINFPINALERRLVRIPEPSQGVTDVTEGYETPPPARRRRLEFDSPVQERE